MKDTIRTNEESAAQKKGRKVAAIIHIVFLGLLAFPFLQISSMDEKEETYLVMDFSSGSSQAGVRAPSKAATSPKTIETPKIHQTKPVETTTQKEEVEVKASERVTEEVKEPATATAEEIETVSTDEVESPVAENGGGAADEGEGDADEGSAANGNGKGFIEGDGVLTRAVVKYGNTKELAKVNGTMVLKICINRRGVVTFAEWDKEQSSIKDSGIAREALKNVLEYRFEKDQSAPKKECGRLTYIFDVQ